MNKKHPLSASMRVRSAFTLHRKESPGVAISVSELCRLAGVNRSSLYQNHPDLVEEILAHKPPRKKPLTAKGSRTVSSHEKRDLVAQNKTLLYLCLELKAELSAMKAISVHGNGNSIFANEAPKRSKDCSMTELSKKQKEKMKI